MTLQNLQVPLANLLKKILVTVKKTLRGLPGLGDNGDNNVAVGVRDGIWVPQC